jgi:hypothetical protein
LPLADIVKVAGEVVCGERSQEQKGARLTLLIASTLFVPLRSPQAL